MRTLRPLAPALLLCLLTHVAAAQRDQPPARGGATYELGMPPVWKGHAGAMVSWRNPGAGSGDEIAAQLHFGLMKDLGSPVVGLGAWGLEGYGGFLGSGSFDGGARALFSIPAMHVTVGADWNVPDGDVDFLARLEIPFRRSGIFGRGSQVRFDWLPGRDHTVALGVNVPLWGRNIGQTRPQRDGVEFDRPPIKQLTLATRSPGLDAALADVAASARWIALLTQPVTDRGSGEAEKKHRPALDSLAARLGERDLPTEILAYHEALDRAFSIAAGGADGVTEQGRAIAAGARRYLLDFVLFPYNRYLGQRKSTDGLATFRADATTEFTRWFLAEHPMPAPRASEVFFAFQQLLAVAEDVRALERKRWDDSRFVWLPLQLALRPEEHDTQAELDAIVERATGRAFTNANRIWYVMNEQFQVELGRSILAARKYHVLWVHDYRGVNGKKEPDAVAFGMTVNVYLEAMLQAVRRYDSTGVLPEYFIFIDQHYFEGNKSRLFFRVLHEPLDYVPSLPADKAEWTARLKAKQAMLREAVAQSRLLQTERSQYGDAWLKKRLRIRLNVTNPSDFSFTSHHVAGIFPVPDNLMRDHRKIAFYDVDESDPYGGLAIYTGMGVGEHYTGANWEDRALMVQGPSTLSVRDAAVDLLRMQGFTEQEIPWPLRPQPRAADYDAKVAEVAKAYAAFGKGWTGRVLELHNATGFATKLIDVEKAVLYSLMPPGSVIKIPDSLWQSYLYGSLLAGSALRGCRVMVVAPTLKSAPSAGPPSMARAHALFSTLIVFQQALGARAEAQGGFLKTGLYAPRAGVGDLAGRLRQGRERREPWAQALFAPNPGVDAVVDSAEALLASVNYTPRYLMEGDSTPPAAKLHLKANLFLSGSAWDRLVKRPEWAPVVREYLLYLARQTRRDVAVDEDVRVRPEALVDAVRGLARGMDEAPPTAREHDVAYFTVGSANMDARSMVMDGEVMVTITGWSSMSGLLDFLLLAGLCEWVDTQEQLDALLPPVKGVMRSLADFGKLAM